MRLINSLKILIVSSVLVGCGSAPKFPSQVKECALIFKDGKLESSYGYCVNVLNTNDKLRKPILDMVKEKYVCVSADDYGALLTWKENLIEWGAEHCK